MSEVKTILVEAVCPYCQGTKVEPTNSSNSTWNCTVCGGEGTIWVKRVAVIEILN